MHRKGARPEAGKADRRFCISKFLRPERFPDTDEMAPGSFAWWVVDRRAAAFRRKANMEYGVLIGKRKPRLGNKLIFRLTCWAAFKLQIHL